MILHTSYDYTIFLKTAENGLFRLVFQLCNRLVVEIIQFVMAQLFNIHKNVTPFNVSTKHTKYNFIGLPNKEMGGVYRSIMLNNTNS
uniref:Uncharacterized protein n=1 Tax=Strongyloides venezuelensis TaxID=75913 RepID=A0A0K0G674_STRVS